MLTEDEFLEHFDRMDDESLEHYGKKGMKWGQIKGAASSAAGAVAGAARRQGAAVVKNQKLNSASRQNDKMARDNGIDAARANVSSGSNKAALKGAKVSFKSDKKELGSREAKKILSAVKDKNANDRLLADKMKSGSETVNYLLFGITPRASGSGLGFNMVLDKTRVQ